MSTDFNRNILAQAGVNPARDEQAQAALKVFRQLQPTLSMYARLMTGRKDVSVQMAAGSNGHTDGKTIYMRPPLTLADKTQHERRLCDKRDPDSLLMICPACRVREAVLVTIFHEIGHIAGGTFAGGISDADKRDAVEWAIKEAGGDYGRRIAERLKATPTRQLTWFGALASVINEYLPIIVNAMEDARVDARMFDARKGLRKAFMGDYRETFGKGFEDKDGMHHWSEAPLNAQAMIGTFVLASGLEPEEGWFHPDIMAVLADPALRDLCVRARTDDGKGIFRLSFLVLARLRELGYCGTPQDPDPQPEPEPEPEEQPQDETPAEDVEPEEGSEDPEVPGEGDQADPTSGEEQGASGESVDVPPEGADASDGQASGDAEGEPGEASGDDPADAPVSDKVDNEGEPSDQKDDGSSSDEEASGSDAGEPGDADGGSSPGGSEDDGEGGDAGDGGESAEGSESDEGDDAEGAGGPGRGDRRDEADPGVPGDGAGEDRGPEEGDGGVDHDEEGVSSESSDGNESDDHTDADAGDGSSEAGDGSEYDAGDSSGDGQSGGDSESEGSAGSPVPGDDGRSDHEHGSDFDDAGTGTAGDGGLDSPGDDSSLEGERAEAAAEDADLSADSDGDGAALDAEEVSPSESTEADDDELIDTGADDGYGGTRVNEHPRPELGEPDDVKELVMQWDRHEKPSELEMSAADQDAMDRAIIQGIYFTHPSANVFGVEEYDYDEGNQHMNAHAWESGQRPSKTGIGHDIEAPESILQPAIGRTRRAFSDNQRGGRTENLKRGQVNSRVLGQRAWDSKDGRLFMKRSAPKHKDYEVIMGVDISGSTVGRNIVLEKRAVMAQAEMLSRVGIKFSIYAHTGAIVESKSFGSKRVMLLQMYRIKQAVEPWGDKVKTRLRNIGASSANLDGHALEYLRKRADESRATHKIILYYSDGKMPVENHDEELAVLQREIRTCRAKGYTLLGVGIRTDSPKRHGLDTVQVDDDDDLASVVKHLEKRISGMD